MSLSEESPEQKRQKHSFLLCPLFSVPLVCNDQFLSHAFHHVFGNRITVFKKTKKHVTEMNHKLRTLPESRWELAGLAGLRDCH